jgi:starvation-inducible DNA-binding protein
MFTTRRRRSTVFSKTLGHRIDAPGRKHPSGGCTMHETHDTSSPDIRARSVEILNEHLAASIDLQAQIKQAHWNVRGPSFIAVHELFDRVAEKVETFSDLIAERTGGLGGTAHGTVQVASERSFLVPYDLGVDTADLFTEVSRGVDQQPWLVESHTSAAPTATEASAVAVRSPPRVLRLRAERTES